MKRIWLSCLILLLLAVPAWGDTHTYTDALADHDASAAGNWDIGVPADGDTIDIANEMGINPTTPISGGGGGDGATFHFLLTTGNGLGIDLEAFIDRTGGTPDAIGNVQLSGVAPDVGCTGPIGGTVILDADSGSIFSPIGGITIAGKITIGASCFLSPTGVVVANGGMDFAGLMYIDAEGDGVDSASPINCTGDCEI